MLALLCAPQVRALLEACEVQAVQRLLGRPYRLVASVPLPATAVLQQQDGTALLPSSMFLNQPPAPGVYRCGAVAVPVAEAHSSNGTGSKRGERGASRSASGSAGSRTEGTGSWEPITVPTLVPHGEDAAPSGTVHSLYQTGSSSSNGSASRGAEQTPGVMQEVTLGVQGIALGRRSRLLEQLQHLGDQPCYLVLDFDAVEQKGS